MRRLQRTVGVFLVAMVAGLGLIAPAMAQDAGVSETVRANVIICVDPDCADMVNIETMEGATITSYAADGSVVDSCTVTLTQADIVDCTLVPAPEGGSYGVTPAAMYSGYVLVSTQPEVFESEMHGPVYVWYFAPEKDNIAPPPPPQPPASAPVTTLPSTGVGIGSRSDVLAGAAFWIAALAVAATGIRKLERD